MGHETEPLKFSTKNMCDGCQRGLPLVEVYIAKGVVSNIHKGAGYDMIGCTKDRYINATDKDVPGK